jgi:hypothetical protein
MEAKTQPDYYEGNLSAVSSEQRARLENDLSDMYERLPETRGLAKLKLQKQLNRLEQTLAWQGANPKELPIGELRAHIHESSGDDALTAKYRAKIRNRATAIRAMCVMCMGGDTAGVRQCPSITCPLHPFRMGKDPLRGYEMPKAEMPEIEDDEDDTGAFEEGDDGDDKDASE